MMTDNSGDAAVLCGMCGGPAVSGCEARLVMYAPSALCLDGLGHPVQRRKGRDNVRIAMPRCGGCRSWVSRWIAVVATVTVAAGIAGTSAQSVFFSEAAPPPWLKVYQEGIGNVGTGIGLVLGFVVALLGMAWKRKRSGRRSANAYPPVVSLRKLGWTQQGE